MPDPNVPPPIEDYALIGDCATAALVSLAGSIDWLCWPRFDSGACFAALLGTSDNGRWLIAPSGGNASRASRQYQGDTLILETVFETESGSVAVIDFMPPYKVNSTIVRIVEGRGGRVAMGLDIKLRFDYGASVPWVTRLADGPGGRAIVGPDMVVLRSDVALRGEGLSTVADFEIAAGERVTFVLSHGPSHLPDPAAIDAHTALEQTRDFWTEWTARCTYEGEWRDAVMRSLITLKALTFAPTGGIVAAPTTSLPEMLGGERNWDYRYCWLRDATFTLMAMLHCGYVEEARAWRDWLHRSIAGSPDQIQIMYGLAGERRLAEWEVGWLAGYQGARPVRIGNAAAGQLQLDVYGELMDALFQASRHGLADPGESWTLQDNLIEHLEQVWREPDEGIWETRGGRRHFTFSKVMAWVALDRAVRSVEEFGVEGPVERWRTLRQQIHDSVCENGFSTAKNSFVQSYGREDLDASVLLIPLVGFLPIDDPRVVGTVAAIERELIAEGFVLRYKTDDSKDGLPPGEGVFLACSFWLADTYAMQGRTDEARALFQRLLALGNDVGLLAEEFEPRAQRQVGNFPQAFSHLGLIGTALNLSGIQARDGQSS